MHSFKTPITPRTCDMTLTTRYLLRNLLSVTAFIAVTLTAVIWLTQSLKLLEIVANSDAPVWLFFKMVALTLPRFLEIILPLALVTSILFVYNKMIIDNELIIMRSCGCDQRTLARPALGLATAITLILLALSTTISPLSTTAMQNLRTEIQAEYSSFLLREGVFNTFGKSLTVYLRARDTNGDLLGLMIHDMRDKKNPPVTVTAKRGRIVMDGDTPNIIVFDGMRQQMDKQGGTVSRLYFSKYTIEIKGLEGDATQRWRKAEERTFLELLRPDKRIAREKRDYKAFLAEAHHRIITPLNTIGFALTALVAILTGPFSRRGQTRKVMTAAAIVIILQALNLALVSLARKQYGAVPLLYLATFTPVIAGFYFLSEKGERKLAAALRFWQSFRFSPGKEQTA